MEPPSELLAMVPCILDFLDLDGLELMASNYVTSNDGIENIVLPELLKNSTTLSKDTGSFTLEKGGSIKTESSSLTDQNFSLTATEFFEKFRLHRNTYAELLSALKKCKKFTEGETVLLQDNLLITLHYLGSQDKVQQMCQMFHSDETNLFNVINSTIDSLYELMPHFINWPDNSTKERIKEGYEKICKFSSVIGVIDSTHLECVEEEETQDLSLESYLNADGKPTIILQAVCDHEMRFLHCCTGWPGALDIASVFHFSDLFQDIRDKYLSYFPDNSHILANKDYPLYQWLIIPFGKEKKNLSENELEFNFYHSLALDVISKAFLHLKRRFPRLLCLSMNDLARLVKTVLICCALHNLCVNQGDTVLFTDTDIHEFKAPQITDVKDRIYTQEGFLKRKELTKHYVQK